MGVRQYLFAMSTEITESQEAQHMERTARPSVGPCHVPNSLARPTRGCREIVRFRAAVALSRSALFSCDAL